MAISVKDLLRYKAEVPLKNKKGETVKTVWVRLLGDEDLNTSYKIARIASLRKRKALHDHESIDFLDQISPIEESSREELEDTIVQANRNKFQNEAYVKVDREEVIKIEDIADEPDAPSLEEQESLDVKIGKQVQDYEQRITKYVDERVEVLRAELGQKTDEEILAEAQKEMANVLPLQTFFTELNAQKAFRGTYEDKECRQRAFENEDDFTNSESSIKEQLITAYLKLELNPDDVKN